MKAIRIHELVVRNHFAVRDAPVPQPGEGQVLVRIKAASVNPIDWKLASSNAKRSDLLELPWIPGGDFAGVVEAVRPWRDKRKYR